MVDFILIGHRTAVALDLIYDLMVEGKMFYGSDEMVKEFIGGDVAGEWFTSFQVRIPPFLELKEYKEGEYKKDELYGIINVDKISDIPDYQGVMGVPITFMKYWNREQFDVLGKTGGGYRYRDYVNRDYLDSFGRIFIKKR